MYDVLIDVLTYRPKICVPLSYVIKLQSYEIENVFFVIMLTLGPIKVFAVIMLYKMVNLYINPDCMYFSCTIMRRFESWVEGDLRIIIL